MACGGRRSPRSSDRDENASSAGALDDVVAEPLERVAGWDAVVYPTSLLPIGGYGFGALLIALHIVPSEGTFPFSPFELAALIPAYWFALGALGRRRTLGQFVASYCLALFAFLFFARYFADNYLAALIALVLCVPLLTSSRCDPVEDLPSRSRTNRNVGGVAEPGALPIAS